MADVLSRLRPPPGSRSKPLRVGRGPGSGIGCTCGRGDKGDRARGGSPRPGFEGGQMPLLRRLPKRGFTPPRPRLWNVVNLRDLGRFPPGSTVDAGVLRAARLVRRPGPVKILAQGTIDRPLVVRVDAFSGTARERIVAAGGVAEQLAPRPEDAAAGAAPAAEADAGGGKQAR